MLPAPLVLGSEAWGSPSHPGPCVLLPLLKHTHEGLFSCGLEGPVCLQAFTEPLSYCIPSFLGVAL